MKLHLVKFMMHSLYQERVLRFHKLKLKKIDYRRVIKIGELNKQNGEKGIQNQIIIQKIKLKSKQSAYGNLICKTIYLQFSFCNLKFTLKTILMLMNQSISRLGYLHSQEVNKLVRQSIFEQTQRNQAGEFNGQNSTK
ncbi:unnamed protein product [Paramecium pentaurelia]|uniref:Uncharacterized protein n=1 Tax=Paramecium pentaurelia TaxID=43138 RepID=A0A8S1VEY4_9CILI|nr:unnamed protein product [Paramecium pentaurelia]CAD8175695.1 unnamed protein product [Paramecium pentaurelia]